MFIPECKPKQMMMWHNVFKQCSLATAQYLIKYVPAAHDAYHTLPFGVMAAKVDNAKDRLVLLVQYFYHLPPQGSPDWEKMKKETAFPTFGGSDIDVILDFNQYKNMMQMYASRLGLAPFDGNTSTQWGNMCEEVSSQLCEIVFECETWETGSLPGLEVDGNIIQRYSPDRIGVVSKKKIEPFLEFTHGFSFDKKENGLKGELKLKKWNTVLFEYKNPIRRVPNNRVPKQYSGQMQLGMSTLNMISKKMNVNMSIFVDCMIRKCSGKDFGLGPEYDNCFHDVPCTSTPKYAGVMFYYNDVREVVPANYSEVKSKGVDMVVEVARIMGKSGKIDMKLLKEIAAKFDPTAPVDDVVKYAAPRSLMRDYGEADDFIEFIEKLVKQRFHPGLKTYYDHALFTGGNAQEWLAERARQFEIWCFMQGVTPVGYMPWKVMELSFVLVPRYEGFMEVVAPKLIDAHAKLMILRAAPDRAKALADMFPPSEATIKRREKAAAKKEASAWWAGDL